MDRVIGSAVRGYLNTEEEEEEEREYLFKKEKVK